MNCLPSYFEPFRGEIERNYENACKDAGTDSATVKLVFKERTLSKSLYESEFAAVADPATVRVTWNGLASLWAFSQGAARIARKMFEAQRADDPSDHPTELKICGELETGLYLIELSHRLAKHRYDHWVDWAPEPNATVDSGACAEGNKVFFGALSWILRHELAHHALKHHDNRTNLPDDNHQQEFEADKQATMWMKSGLKAEPTNRTASRPPPQEIELERRSLAIFIGMIWVAQFELGPHGTSSTHPDANLRLISIFQCLNLAPDSFAAEILAYLVKVMIDPEGYWPKSEDEPTAIDAAIDALIRLSRQINQNKR